MNITVIGDGGWGSALALVLARNGHSVRIWGPDADYAASMRATRLNPRFLPGVPFPDAIDWSTDPAAVLDGTAAVVFVVPSKFARATLERFAPAWRAAGSPPVVSAVKGFDENSLSRISTLVASLWETSVAVLSGPSIAPETARGIPTAVTVASENPDSARFFQSLFSGDSFRVYTASDVVGVELGGAVKNVIALAAGICDGLSLGVNAKAALVTRGLAEMARLGAALGADPFTFYGLSGVGDLMVTCMSPQSRNRTVGERIGRGERLDDILSGMRQVAEGVQTIGPALALARAHSVSTPLMDAVEAVLAGRLAPRDAVLALMRRNPRAEQDS